MAMMVSTMLSSLALETLPVPAAHRRHPFDLHWRREPPDWAGNLTGAYGRLYAGLMTSRCDVCCVSCGAVPCPYDHDEDKRVRLTDLQFVRELANQRKGLQADLEQMKESNAMLTAELETWKTERLMLQQAARDAEKRRKTWEEERKQMMETIKRLKSTKEKQMEDLANYKKSLQQIQELNDKVSQLEAENTSVKQENNTLQYRIGECQMEIRKLTEELKLAQRSADDARRDVKVVQSQLTEANDTISVLRADVKTKDAQARKAQAESTQLGKQLEEKARQLARQERDNKLALDELHRLVYQLQSSLSEARETSEELQRQVEEHLATIRELQRRLSRDNRFQEFVDIKREVIDLKDENDTLRMHISDPSSLTCLPTLTEGGKTIKQPLLQSPASRVSSAKTSNVERGRQRAVLSVSLPRSRSARAERSLDSRLPQSLTLVSLHDDTYHGRW